jgi:hypothetical protein
MRHIEVAVGLAVRAGQLAMLGAFKLSPITCSEAVFEADSWMSAILVYELDTGRFQS